MISLKPVFLIAIVAIAMIGIMVPNIMDVDAATACSLTHMNEFIMKSAEPRICERVNYWVHYECGRIPGMYLTDERCQPPAGFPLEKLASFGSFMELNLDKEIYKMGDSIQVYGNVYSSVGIPTENLGIRITNSDGQKILEQKANFDGFGKFAFKILTGTTISINDEGNYELYVVHYGKYGSSAIKKFTVSNDGLPIVVPIVVPTVVTPPLTPVPTVVTPPPTPIQDPEPFTTNWITIGAILIVITVVGYPIYKKVTRSGFSKISTNYSNTKEEHNNDSNTKEEHNNDSNTKEEHHNNSKKSKDPIHPTPADIRNNFKRYDPDMLEKLVVKLFTAQRYTAKQQGVANQSDGGIDVKATKDGIEIFIQVKHWAGSNKPARAPDVRDFYGAITNMANKGIFITTSKFTKDAIEWANDPSRKKFISLWDIEKLKQEVTNILIEGNYDPIKEESKPNLDFNYYEILGANRTDTQDEIKKKYKELSLKFHPDKARSALSENMMKQVNEAYAVLRDTDKKRQYDLELDSA
jgi:hypothetical protein